MKIVKNILIVLVALLVIITTVGFLSPKHVHVERSIVVNAPSEIVHGQINNLKNWKNWSPWYKLDTAMQMEFSGPDAGTGASYKWNSANKNVGQGEMTITASNADSICTALNFMENGVAAGSFIFNKTDNGTQVTWTMDSDMGMNPIGRIFGLFMDKMLGPDFEKGLAGIKEVAEAAPAGPKKYRGYEVIEEDAPERVYIIKKDSMGWDKIAEFYEKTMPALFEAVEKAKLEITGTPAGLYFSWDTVTKTTVTAAAIPVKGDANTKVKGYETMVIAPQKNLHITYLGGYSNMATPHYAMDDYMKEKKLTHVSPVIEEYVTGPMQEKDSTKWVTNIYYPVK